MLTIKVCAKKWNLANTFCHIVKWRMEDTESSTLPYHPLTFRCWTVNWIMYSKSWNVLQKLTLHLDSFLKILRMECADTFMLTRTILLWRSRNLRVHQTISSTWKRNYRKWILVIFVHEREPIQNGSFINWQMRQCLQRYSKIYQWDVKIQSYLNHFSRTIMWIVLLLREIRTNPTMTISVCSEH